MERRGSGAIDQDVIDPGAGPAERVFGDTDIMGDLVGGLEADSVDLLGQHVGIPPDSFDGLVTIGL